jgi:ectoine hydroxylase-related dioxygenase (phytanoyl-CoA dioxygenase family)
MNPRNPEDSKESYLMSQTRSTFLTSDQRRQFDDDGYLIVEDVIDVPEYITPMVEQYEQRLDRLAQALYADGHISSPFEG